MINYISLSSTPRSRLSELPTPLYPRAMQAEVPYRGSGHAKNSGKPGQHCESEELYVVKIGLYGLGLVQADSLLADDHLHICEYTPRIGLGLFWILDTVRVNVKLGSDAEMGVQ